MNSIGNSEKSFIMIDYASRIMFILSLLLLGTMTFEGNLAPIILFIFMIIIAMVLIGLFSSKNEMFLKIKLFIFFFSLYLTYTLINHYILLITNPNTLPYDYIDERTFYYYSDLGLHYISGEKNFFDLFTFASYPMHDVSLHVMFSSLITYLSNLIDGHNTIIVQKFLSPFFGGILSVVLYSTLKFQFKNPIFALNATLAYSLLSAVFIYSIPLLRDIDIALAYMIFIYLFLQPNSYKNFFLLLFVAFVTTYLRTESGMVLYGLILLYGYLYIRKLQSISIKLLFYMFLMILFILVVLLMLDKITIMITGKNTANLARSTAQASSGSIGILLNKLPFPLSSVAKMLFGQLQPFPFFLAINKLPSAISGIFWPFIFIMMFYALIKRSIRNLIDIKVKYLLIVAITVLFLMSSEPMARRMMSVYPVMYIVSLYAFIFIPKNDIKRIFIYYIFAIYSLNVFYYLIKL